MTEPDPPLGLPDREITLNDIDHTRRLLSNRIAMHALHHLYRGGGPAWVAQNVQRQAAIDAIAILEQAGLIATMEPGVPEPAAPVSITGKGIAFVETLGLNDV